MSDEGPRGRDGRILGALLAGGASSRFGSPKWMAELAGASMGARAVAVLEASFERVGAISSDPAVAALGVEVRSDSHPGTGPIGAIHTALVWAAELSLDGAFLLACDLPLVDAALVRALSDAWEGEDVVVPVGPRGPEPLCALYSTRARAEVEASLARGDLAAWRLIERLGARTFPLERVREVSEHPDPFLNVNTREEHARAERELTLEPEGER